VGMATASLGHAVTTIKRATKDCPNDPYDEKKCPLDMTEIFVLFAHTAAYFTSGISNCPLIEQENMMCESRVAKFIASLGQIAVAAQGIHQDCVRVHHMEGPKRRLEEAVMPVTASAALPTVPALASVPEVPAVPEVPTVASVPEVPAIANPPKISANASFIAHCSIKASTAVFLFGKASIDIAKAIRYCPKANDFNNNNGAELKCSVAFQSSIGALGTVASTLASVALECAESLNVDQKCGLDVSKLVMGLVEVGASATGLQLDCVWRYNQTHHA